MSRLLPRRSVARPPHGANEPRLLLAAIRLAITHPVTGLRMTFQMPIPPEFTPP